MLASSGIVVATSKSIAKIRYQKTKTKVYIKSSFFISIIFSIFLSIFFAVLTPIFANNQGDGSFVVCYFIVLPCIFLSGICAVFRGYFFGKNKMVTNGLAQIVEQITKIVFAIMLSKLFLDFGIVYTVAGAFLGITASEIILTLYYFINFKNNSKNRVEFTKIVKYIDKIRKTKKVFTYKANRQSFWLITKRMIATSFFVTIQASILPLVSAIDGIIVVPMLVKSGLTNQVAYSVFGLSTGLVASIISLPLVVASSVGSAIIPNIQNSNKKDINNKISFAIKVVWLFCIGFSVLIFLVPNQIVSFLFSGSLSAKVFNEVQICADILKISCFGSMYLCLLTLSTSILQGLGKSQIPAINLFVSMIFRFFVLNLLFNVQNLSIYSLAISDILFYGLAFALNMFAIKRNTKIKLSFAKTLVYPTISAIIMAFSIIFSKSIFSNLLSPKILTLTICAFGMFAYLLSLIFTKTIDILEIKNFLFKKRNKA